MPAEQTNRRRVAGHRARWLQAGCVHAERFHTRRQGSGPHRWRSQPCHGPQAVRHAAAAGCAPHPHLPRRPHPLLWNAAWFCGRTLRLRRYSHRPGTTGPLRRRAAVPRGSDWPRYGQPADSLQEPARRVLRRAVHQYRLDPRFLPGAGGGRICGAGETHQQLPLPLAAPSAPCHGGARRGPHRRCRRRGRRRRADAGHAVPPAAVMS